MTLLLSQLDGLDKGEEEDLKGSFLQALIFRMSIIKVLRNKISNKRKKSNSENFISEGDFAVKMAWTMGYEKAQEEFITLMDSTPQK